MRLNLRAIRITTICLAALLALSISTGCSTNQSKAMTPAEAARNLRSGDEVRITTTSDESVRMRVEDVSTEEVSGREIRHDGQTGTARTIRVDEITSLHVVKGGATEAVGATTGGAMLGVLGSLLLVVLLVGA